MKEIVGFIKSKPGELFNLDQVRHDREALLATGNFTPYGTRVTTEAGVRGGVCVIFQVSEVPLIVKLRFMGINLSDQSAVAALLRKIDIREGAPANTTHMTQAEGVIREYFENKGWQDVRVEALVENTGAFESNIVFRVTAYRIPL